MSQLVLPVGVTGLMVNGNTPTPEPGGAVAMEVVSLGKVGEDTHTKVTFGTENTISTPHADTRGRESVYRRHACRFHLFLVFAAPPLSQGTESHVHVTSSSEIQDSNP